MNGSMQQPTFMQIMPPQSVQEAQAQQNNSCPACRRGVIPPTKVALLKANSTGPVVYTKRCPHCSFEVSQPARLAFARDGYAASAIGKPVDNHHVDVVDEMMAEHVSTCPHAPVRLCAVGSGLTNRAFVSHAKLCDSCFGGTIRSLFSDYAHVSASLASHVAAAAAH